MSVARVENVLPVLLWQVFRLPLSLKKLVRSLCLVCRGAALGSGPVVGPVLLIGVEASLLKAQAQAASADTAAAAATAPIQTSSLMSAF